MRIFLGQNMPVAGAAMYLIDTNVISEVRKKERAHPGVVKLFDNFQRTGEAVYLSCITIGEIQRGISLCQHRGDRSQALILDTWLEAVTSGFAGNILPFCTECARLWGHLCVPDNTSVLDKQLAATALVYDLTLVTRNVRHVSSTGVRLLNPFV